MNLEQLKTAVEAQKKAFALLLWIKQRVQADADFLEARRDEILGFGRDCAAWIGREWSSFPCDLRVPADEARAVGFVLSSFFRTSVRIANVKRWHQNGVEIKLVTGAVKFTGRRHKLYARRRQKEAADELCRLALGALAAESEFELSETAWEQTLAQPEVVADLTLWTYGCELVRRCEYASQGTAVHLLWLALEESARKNLSADCIWQARERLVQWLAAKAWNRSTKIIIPTDI